MVGRKTIEYKFNKYFSHDEHELNAAIEVIKSKQLSGFAAEEGAGFTEEVKSRSLKGYVNINFKLNMP